MMWRHVPLGVPGINSGVEEDVWSDCVELDYEEDSLKEGEIVDSQGHRPREHRQQSGGAPTSILTAAVQPRSEAASRRAPADLPLLGGILHGGGARSAAMRILTPPTAILFMAGKPP
ncbi:hypothetical protein NDU88_002598 [Pleurodeles waltl]|uniref:Uncharacterized protein n=1 Tax=Pleurodeles waltl TaxID=8319 RepID=A0AAV7LGB5_PLEWA|nr:hypothetical protein NDU88_002598 [Pleurodeles waltl]